MTRPRDAQEFVEFATGQVRVLETAAWMLTTNEHAAQDLLQSALERVYRRWGSIRTDPMAYTRRTMVNIAIDSWRRTGREHVVADGELDPPVADDVELLAVVERDGLLRALRALSVRERAVILLRFVDDRSEAETAEILDCARGTVKSTSARAISKLRRDLSSTEARGDLR